MLVLKTPLQIEGIRSSGHVLARLFDFLRPHVSEGAVPLELDRLAEDFIRKNGAQPAFKGYNGFPASLCISINDAVIHGIPSQTPLRAGDLVSIDCGVLKEGYYSDAAFSIGIPPLDKKIQRCLQLTEEALYKGIDQVRPGNRLYQIGKAISQHLAQENYGVVYEYCGHGVGLSLHEEPLIPNYEDRRLQMPLRPGMVIAIEPMVNLGSPKVQVANDKWTVRTKDGSVSVHFEHTVAVLDTGFEILTRI